MVIGLTGYTGAGKSTVAQIFYKQGAYIIDADRLARRAVEPGQPALREIAEIFGEDMLLQDGSLNRRALGNAVFADDEKRKCLEKITHPRIAALTAEKVQKAVGRTIVIDAPVLFAVPDIVKLCDSIVFVDAPPELRLRRIMDRDGLSGQEASRRMEAQGFMESWKRQCDIVLENRGDLQQLEREISAWQEVQRGNLD